MGLCNLFDKIWPIIFADACVAAGNSNAHLATINSNGAGVNKKSKTHPAPQIPGAPGTVVTRGALTLWCHYYPEGGWGWLVLIAASGSHVLPYGTQLALLGFLYKARGVIIDWPLNTSFQGRL